MLLTIKKRLCLVIAILFLGACSHQDADDKSSSSADPSQRVMLIGLDGLDWNVINPLLEKNKLPNLKRLMDKGVYANLISIEPSKSPVVWTTIATGDSPEQHGITDFLVQGKPADSTKRKTKALWNVLSEIKKTVGVVGYYVTWPVEAVSGYMISNRTHNSLSKGYNPPDVDKNTLFSGIDFDPYMQDEVNFISKEELLNNLARFTEYAFDFNYAVDFPLRSKKDLYHFLIQKRLAHNFNRDSIYMRVGTYLLKNHRQPDFFTIYLRGSDAVSHAFWRYYEPDKDYFYYNEPVTDKEKQLFGNIIPNYYIFLDECVGNLLALIDPATNVIIVSDHGSRADYKPAKQIYWYLTGNHRPEGIFIAAGPAIKKLGLIKDLSVYDVNPAVLYLMGGPQKKNAKGAVPGHIFKHPIKQTGNAFYNPAREQVADVKESLYKDEVMDELRALGYID